MENQMPANEIIILDVISLAGIGFAIHTVSIVYRYISAGHIPITNAHEATSFFSWFIVFIFFILEFRYRILLISSFIMPVVFILMLSSSLMPQEIKPLTPMLQSYWLCITTVLSFF